VKMTWTAALILAAIGIACIPDGVQEEEGSISAERLRNAALRDSLYRVGLITEIERDTLLGFEMMLLDDDILSKFGRGTLELAYIDYREQLAERLNATEEIW